MEPTRKTDEKGVTTQTNWMLDEVIDTLKEFSITDDELTKKLAIEKIEYGRVCMMQVVGQADCGYEAYRKLDADLQALIIDLGGMPKNRMWTGINTKP